MWSKIKKWIKETYWDDPYEQTALIAFGIGCPLILGIFGLTLIIIK